MAPTRPPIKRRSLAAIVGAGAAAALLAFVPAKEGTKLTTYRDLGGVLTYCTGATEDAAWGKTYTPQQCQEQLDKDLAKHAERVASCLAPVWDKLPEGPRVAFVDHDYNTGGFCGSTAAHRANAGDTLGACRALESWVCITVPKGAGDTLGPCTSKEVNKRFVQGLANRRADERAICERGLR